MSAQDIHIRYYTKKDCTLCSKGLELLRVLSHEIPLSIKEFDIYEDDELLEKYQLMIPVVEANGQEIGYGLLNWGDLRRKLLSLKDEHID